MYHLLTPIICYPNQRCQNSFKDDFVKVQKSFVIIHNFEEMSKTSQSDSKNPEVYPTVVGYFTLYCITLCVCQDSVYAYNSLGIILPHKVCKSHNFIEERKDQLTQLNLHNQLQKFRLATSKLNFA